MSRGGGGDDIEDQRMRMRSFLYIVRHDLSLTRSDLHRLVELNEEYAKNGSLDWRWKRVIEHAGIAIRSLEERRNYISRNLGEIRDLTKGDPSLEPGSFVLQTVDPSRDVFGLASTITDPKSQQNNRHDLALGASREIQRLDYEIERLDGMIRSSNDSTAI